jgi:hypothetical protein
MTSEQFWSLSPAEFWWWVEARTPKPTWGDKHPMFEDEVRDIYEDAYGPYQPPDDG